MSDSDRTRVLLFGLGAIGGFYAFIIGRDPTVSLAVTARSNYEVVKQNGLQIESMNHGKHSVRIDNVLRHPSEAKITFDYIVCTNKALNPDTIPKFFHDVADENTAFVILQNGVGNEEPFRESFPNCTIISGVVWVGATQVTPGLVKHRTSENTELGLFPHPHSDQRLERMRLERFAKILEAGGTKFTIEDDIQVKKWEKLIWNAAWNPITTLTRVETLTWLDSSPEAAPVTRRLWTEMIDVARRCGVRIEYGLIDELFRRIRTLPPIFTSMYVDSIEGRQLEIEVILGYPLKKAKEFEMDVPVLTAIYAMSMAVDERIRQGKS